MILKRNISTFPAILETLSVFAITDNLIPKKALLFHYVLIAMGFQSVGMILFFVYV
uniref:Uncharacterized protein n=1 Tax=Arion vulgaris TaxID=1028688 RepID=A0A0B6YH64_9EUPU